MGAFKDLFTSEKGLLAIGILLCATLLVALGKLQVDQWTNFTQVIFGSFVVGKTVTVVGTALAARGQAPAQASALVQGPTKPVA